VDFWAQHKDFILKILAGVGVFLVALIARSITYGDELEQEQAKNARLAQSIRSTQVAKPSEIQDLKNDADRLQANAKAIVGQIGWDVADYDRLEEKLLERILRDTKVYAQQSEENVKRRAEDFRAALREDLNGGFGQLRLFVRDELVTEAKERNIKVPTEGTGFESVTGVEPDELMQYLLQLELVARVVRDAIDARVDGIDEVKITTSSGTRHDEVIPGANPDFIQQYEVTVTVTGSTTAIRAILNQLGEAPCPPLVGIRASRVNRPENHLSVELVLLATAANPDIDFKDKDKDKEKP